jgi:threonine dehydrogenase-like Zn-dependent dehydrogenase
VDEADAGDNVGHENMGVVIETGSGVSLLKKGDRVVMPFNVADRRCRNWQAVPFHLLLKHSWTMFCSEEGRTAFCTGVNPYAS